MIPSRRTLLRQRAHQRHVNCPAGEVDIDRHVRLRSMKAKAFASER